MPRRIALLVGVVLATALAVLGFASPASAATFTVDVATDTVDVDPGDGTCADTNGDCSLRAAIQEANATPGADTVALAAGTHTLSIGGTGEDTAASGDLDVTDDLVLQGNADAVVDADGIDRVFDVVGSPSLAIVDVEITGGTPEADADGGGLRIAGGTTTLTDVDLLANVATGDEPGQGGGGAFVAAGASLEVLGGQISDNTATVGLGNGGGILHAGADLTVTGTDLSSNEAARAGGAVEVDAAPATLDGVTMADNTTGINGGALHSSGAADVTVSDSDVIGNVAGMEGGGLWNSGVGTMQVTNVVVADNEASGPAADQGGGALFNDGGTLVVEGGVLTGNDATGASGSGGGILNTVGGTLEVTGTTISDNTSQRAGGGVEDNAGASAVLSGVELSGNSTGPAPGNGGGLHVTGAGNVSVQDGSVVAGNVAEREGGGLWGSIPGTLTVSDSSVVFNTAEGPAADDGGGGIFNDGGLVEVSDTAVAFNSATGASGSGGGFHNAPGGVLTVDGGSIAANRAVRAGGGIEDNAGGGITVTGTTFSANQTGPTPGNGGALHITGAGTAEIVGATVASNTATAEGGGLWVSAAGELVVTDTLLVGNVAAGAAADQGGGALFNDGGVLEVSGSTVEANAATGASGSGGGLLNTVGGETTITDSTFVANRAERAGGAIEDNVGDLLEITGSTLEDNTVGTSPGNGGGLHITGAGTALVDTTEVLGNTAGNEGGGLWNSAVGVLTVTDTTVAENAAPTGGGVFSQGGDTSLSNTTVSSNDASVEGGGVQVDAGTTTVVSATIAGNTSASGDGISAVGTGLVDITGSVVANNGDEDCATVGADVSGGGNVVSDASCDLGAADDQEDVGDLRLRPLGDYGGSTSTHLLGAGGAAVDGGSATCPPPATDQRDVERAIDGDLDGDAVCDAGSVEVDTDQGFSDVSATHPFGDEIGWMAGFAISTGFEDGTYRPSVAVSRQAMSAFLYRLAGEPAFTAPSSPTFSDVGLSHPFFLEVEWMNSEGITTGFEDGTYRPGVAVSRQAMSAFLYRLAGEPAFTAPSSPTFSDVGLSHPFFLEVEWMNSEGITTGFEDGTYRPGVAVSRQAMSAFLFRLAPLLGG